MNDDELMQQILARLEKGMLLVSDLHTLLAMVEHWRSRCETLEQMLEDASRDAGLLAQDALPGAKARAEVERLKTAIRQMAVEADKDPEAQWAASWGRKLLGGITL